MNITAMITARIGSERLKMKNLALIDGKPMVSYAINAAKNSGVFNRIVLNSDNPIFEKMAERYGVEFYLRPKELGASHIKIDDVIMDYMDNNDCDVLAIVNTPSPLQTPEEVAKGLKYFIDNDFDSMISVQEHYNHAIYNETPINFDCDVPFQRTQDLVPVGLLIYSLMVYKKTSFTDEYKQKGHAMFCGKTGYFKASKESALLVKTEEDIKLIDRIMRSKNKDIEYDILVDSIE